MIFSGVAADDKNYITVLNVYPVICHCAASEGLSQSPYSRAVSDSGMALDIDQAQTAHECLQHPAFFIVQGRGAERRHLHGAVQKSALVIRFFEAFVPGLTDFFRNAGHGPIP